MIRLILFDLDGTLVDSSIDIMHALNYAIGPYGMRPLSVEETIGMVGEGITSLIEKLLGPERADIMPDVMRRFLEYYSAHLADFTRPYPGTRETLEALSGFRKAVISNKRESLSRRLLDELDLSRFFDTILGSDSAGEKKPSPRPILFALDQFSVPAGEAVIVGDSNYDIEAGRAAGVAVIAVSYGFRAAEDLRAADVIIDDIAQLPATIGELERERAG
jgi:phosphoglycolate phosphatase